MQIIQSKTFKIILFSDILFVEIGYIQFKFLEIKLNIYASGVPLRFSRTNVFVNMGLGSKVSSFFICFMEELK